MIFVLTWQVPQEGRTVLLEQFIAAKDRQYEDAVILGRWHHTDGGGGLMVVEAQSVQAVARFMNDWNDLLFGQLVPAVTDVGLAAILAKLKDVNERKSVQRTQPAADWHPRLSSTLRAQAARNPR